MRLRAFTCVQLVLVILCQFLTQSHLLPLDLDSSQIAMLIDPVHNAENDGEQESKKVVAKSVFNTPLRTLPPPVNRCPPGTQSVQDGTGPCVPRASSVSVDDKFLLDALRDLAKKGVIFRGKNPTGSNRNRHRFGPNSRYSTTSTIPPPIVTQTMPQTQGGFIDADFVSSSSKPLTLMQPVHHDPPSTAFLNHHMQNILPISSGSSSSSTQSHLERIPNPQNDEFISIPSSTTPAVDAIDDITTTQINPGDEQQLHLSQNTPSRPTATAVFSMSHNLAGIPVQASNSFSMMTPTATSTIKTETEPLLPLPVDSVTTSRTVDSGVTDGSNINDDMMMTAATMRYSSQHMMFFRNNGSTVKGDPVTSSSFTLNINKPDTPGFHFVPTTNAEEPDLFTQSQTHNEQPTERIFVREQDEINLSTSITPGSELPSSLSQLESISTGSSMNSEPGTEMEKNTSMSLGFNTVNGAQGQSVGEVTSPSSNDRDKLLTTEEKEMNTPDDLNTTETDIDMSVTATNLPHSFSTSESTSTSTYTSSTSNNSYDRKVLTNETQEVDDKSTKDFYDHEPEGVTTTTSVETSMMSEVDFDIDPEDHPEEFQMFTTIPGEHHRDTSTSHHQSLNNRNRNRNNRDPNTTTVVNERRHDQNQFFIYDYLTLGHDRSRTVVHK